MHKNINLTYVLTTIVVAVAGFVVRELWLFTPLGSHGWYRPCSSNMLIVFA